jgi:hypothetical protein
MIHSGYLILLTSTSQLTGEVTQNIHRCAGYGYALYGSSTNFICQTLWLIRRPKNDINLIQQTLSVIPTLQSVSIVPLDIPILPSQVTGIRNLFTALEWISTSVTDSAISDYFESELKGTQTLYFNFDHHTKNKRLTFKLLKDLPEYSTEWEERQRNFSEAIANGLLDDIDSSNLTYTTVEIKDIVDVSKNQ